MRFDQDAIDVMVWMVKHYGFAPITITRQGIELLTMPEAIALAKEAEPEVREKLRQLNKRRKERDLCRLYKSVTKPKG